jgi:hypothetical protein
VPTSITGFAIGISTVALMPDIVYQNRGRRV